MSEKPEISGNDIADQIERERELDLEFAVVNLRLLCVRICRAKTQEQREELVGHANRISAKVGIVPDIRREYTEEAK